MQRNHFDGDHEMFRTAFRSFVDREMVPHVDRWSEAGIVDRELWTEAGSHGFLAFDVPEQFGGPGVRDFRFNQIVTEELCDADAFAAGVGFTLHNDVTLPYFMKYADESQKARWLPGIADGSLITAVAMTEPGIGSDLASMATTAVRDGDVFVSTVPRPSSPTGSTQTSSSSQPGPTRTNGTRG